MKDKDSIVEFVDQEVANIKRKQDEEQVFIREKDQEIEKMSADIQILENQS